MMQFSGVLSFWITAFISGVILGPSVNSFYLNQDPDELLRVLFPAKPPPLVETAGPNDERVSVPVWLPDVTRPDGYDSDPNRETVVFVGNNGVFTESPTENNQDEAEEEFFRRNTRQYTEDWHTDVDGWYRDGDDEVFLPPSVLRGDPKRSRGLDQDLEDDYLYALTSTDAYRRSRRTSDPESGPAVVELLILVDNAVYRDSLDQYGTRNRALKAIKKYYEVLVQLVDSRYKAIEDPSARIRVKLSMLFVAQDRSSSPWSEYHVRRSESHPDRLVLDPKTALEALREWLVTERQRSLRGVSYDHAMAFTRYGMSSAKGKVTHGMAYVGTICDTQTAYSCSIVAEPGGFANAGTAVHELAHSLGARHDGTTDNSACPASQNFIMAPFNSGNPDVMTNNFRFSECTLQAFRETLGSREVSCLLDSQTVEDVSGSGSLPGTVFNPDAQCRDVFGPQSGKCKNKGIQAPEEICARLWCMKPTNPDICITTSSLTALYGTPCGRNKICRHGQCVLQDANNQAAQHMTPTNGVGPCAEDSDSDYCRRLVTEGPQYCDMPDIGKYCCRSCWYARGGGQE